MNVNGVLATGAAVGSLIGAAATGAGSSSAGSQASGGRNSGGVTSLSKTSSHRAWASAGRRPYRLARNAGTASRAAQIALARPIASSVDMGSAPRGGSLPRLLLAVELVDQGAK